MRPGAEESFDPVPILARFAEAGVDFVVIGGVAGGVHGSSFATFDVDLAYSRDPENVERSPARSAPSTRSSGARRRTYRSSSMRRR